MWNIVFGVVFGLEGNMLGDGKEWLTLGGLESGGREVTFSSEGNNNLFAFRPGHGSLLGRKGRLLMRHRQCEVPLKTVCLH
jgi:hypothetical protein